MSSIFFLLLFLGLVSFSPPQFGDRINKGEIVNDEIDEASGLVESIGNPGVIWTHNDSGGENRIFAIGQDGSNKGIYYLDGTTNRDWEDITAGPGPSDGVNYIYIGDIGDNNAIYENKYIYRINEPAITSTQFNVVDTLFGAETITFNYPDGERDSETLMLDPLTKDLFIIGKRDSDIRLYRLPFPQSTTASFEAELVNKLSFPDDPENNTPNNYITGGDISLDGNEIIVKTYSNIYYWNRELDKTIGEVLSEISATELPFNHSLDELQGEAICWNNFEDKGYYTLSEERVFISGTEFNFSAQLYYYPRTSPVNVEENTLVNNFALYQNFPNPFNPSTIIEYELPNEEFVNLTVYDTMGNEVTQLVNEYQIEGRHKVNFNIHSLDFAISSGIYYYSLKYGEFTDTKSMILLK